MTDRIFIRGLTLHAYHGVMPHEGKVGQTFTIDLDLDIDLSEAARTDKVKDTVSYADVAQCVEKAFTGQRFRLIEAAGGAVALALVFVWLGLRPDLAEAAGGMMFWMKAGYAVVLAAAGAGETSCPSAERKACASA